MIFCSLLFLITVTFSNAEPIVLTTSGFVSGTWEQSYNGATYSAFEGIPYARPPTGNLRFEPPKEVRFWWGIRKANVKTACLQGSSFFWNSTTTVGTEDCLHINVYVPRKIPSILTNLDVLVHIHSGGFMYGSAHHYAGPKYLMDREVIFVTMNYRLGPFGFLSTEDEVVPGNNGMKDQVMSLKWIQNNIRYFGGNPRSVTLTGSSAGGASVHLHYFSSLSRGLFHRGFSEAGTALAPWAIQDAAFDKAKQLGELLDCRFESSAKLVNCLKSKSGNEIAEAAITFSPIMKSLPFPFTPVVEKKLAGAFLSQLPYKMLVERKVSNLPWMVGVMEEQGSTIALLLEEIIPMLPKDFILMAPDLLDYRYTIADDDKLNASTAIDRQYFNELYSFQNFAKLMGDRLFVASAEKAARLQANFNLAPVYFYILKYRGQDSFGKIFGLNTDHIGTSLGDNVLYYLNTPVSSKVLSEEDAIMVSLCMDCLLSFANNRAPLIPNTVWEPIRRNRTLRYMSIDSTTDMSMKVVEDLGSNSFWDKLPFQGTEKK